MATPFPVPVHSLPADPGLIDAWRDLQAALAGRHARFLTVSPETRGRIPRFVPEQDCKTALDPGLTISMTAFMTHAGPAICDLFHDWDLHDNPFGVLHLFPGGVIFHEDPLSWVVDAHRADLEDGAPLEDIHAALLLPGHSSGGHAAMASLSAFKAMPASLHAWLDAAAQVNQHDDLCPLVWAQTPGT